MLLCVPASMGLSVTLGEDCAPPLPGLAVTPAEVGRLIEEGAGVDIGDLVTCGGQTQNSTDGETDGNAYEV